MNRFITILFFLIIVGNFNEVHGQVNTLINPNKLDSINFLFTPLYSTDSVDIENLLDSHYINIYYFNGECSICLVKMSEAENFFQEHANDKLKTIFIVETSDTITFNYYRDELNVMTQILWDQHDRLHNQDINTCFLIDKSGNIIIEGDFINDEISQNRYKETIKNIITSR